LACGDVFAGAVEWAWADSFGYPRKQHYRHNWNNSQTTDQKRIAGVRGSRKAKTNHKWPAAMRKLAANTEYQAVHAEAMCKLSADPVWQEAQAERNRKLAADPNWRAVHAKATAESNRRLAKDPKWQKANAEARRKLLANPKWRVAVTEANRKLHADPDYQATCLKAMRKLQAIIHTCDWCDKVGKGTSMKRHHFNNCLLNPDAPRPVSRWTRKVLRSRMEFDLVMEGLDSALWRLAPTLEPSSSPPT
jgi:hypothetical protein